MTLTRSSIVTEADLLAYVDGRLGSERRAEIEDHLARCPQDAGRVAADLALQEGLRVLFGRPASPPVPLRRVRRASWVARVAMAASLAVGGFAAGIWAARLEAAPQITAPAAHSAPSKAIVPAALPLPLR